MYIHTHFKKKKRQHFLPLVEQDTQLGQLQMFKKKPLQHLKKRKERRELCLLNIYVFYARVCKSLH